MCPLISPTSNRMTLGKGRQKDTLRGPKQHPLRAFTPRCGPLLRTLLHPPPGAGGRPETAEGTDEARRCSGGVVRE